MSSTELSKIKKDISAEISKILVSCLLGPGPASSVLSTAASSIVKNLDPFSQEKNIKNVVKYISDDICDLILAGYEQEGKQHRISTALSGLREFRNTISAANLSVEILIDLELDPIKLQDYLHKHKSEHLRKESAHYQQVVARACEEFSQRIITIISMFSGFQVAIFRTILKNQNKIIEQLSKD